MLALAPILFAIIGIVSGISVAVDPYSAKADALVVLAVMCIFLALALAALWIERKEHAWHHLPASVRAESLADFEAQTLRRPKG